MSVNEPERRETCGDDATDAEKEAIEAMPENYGLDEFEQGT